MEETSHLSSMQQKKHGCMVLLRLCWRVAWPLCTRKPPPTRPWPAEVLIINLLLTCLCTVVLAIYHAVPGFQSSRFLQSSDGQGRPSRPKDQDFCAWLAHGKIGGRQRQCATAALEAATREEKALDNSTVQPCTQAAHAHKSG